MALVIRASDIPIGCIEIGPLGSLPIVFAVTAVVTLATIYKGLKHVTGDVEWLTDGVTLAIALGLSLICAIASKWPINILLAGKDDLHMNEQLEEVERVFTPLVIICSRA